MSSLEVREESFPARRREISGPVNGAATDIARVDFADKILVTISQGGRLSHWVRHHILTPQYATHINSIPHEPQSPNTVV
jgi:hypothetical protein